MRLFGCGIRGAWKAVLRFAAQSLLMAAAWLALDAGTALAQPRFDLQGTQTLLPKTVLPSRVDVQLDIDPDLPTFGGRVSITLRASEAVPAIVLHAKELQAEAAELRGDAGAVRALLVQPDSATSTWRLVPADGLPITAGAWRVDIRYRGRVQTSGEGLYVVPHRVQGQLVRMLATQLEAVHARRVLPVFDEPVFRSVFAISVRAPRGYEVLSNMPRVEQQSDGDAVLHRFAPTPSMPSYLLAVTVGRFDVLEDSALGIPLRIFTAPGKREQARLAMQVTKQVLPFYARYFGHPYALPKLDQVAVPGTRVGAMEDWGLISYAEDALLYDPARSSRDTERTVFSVAAHEIAHQWFGNLVSAASWNEIWLNEAFATWMEHKAVEHFHPEWQTALRQRSEIDSTMDREATPATRAIRSGPVSEGSVFEVFDDITYVKGGAVLTMIEQWLGPETFQRGLAAYMAERAYKPATAGDLWFHIGRAAGQPVADVAASWTDQPGLPLVTLGARCDTGNTVITLRQGRLSQHTPLAGGPWRIPVRLQRGAEVRTVLLQTAQQTTVLPGCTQQPLLANAGGRGFYRVDADPLQRAQAAAAFETLAPGDRVALLSDSHALAAAGRRPMADHFVLLAALPLVRDASRGALFSMAAAQLAGLDIALHDTPTQTPLRSAAHALLAPELARLSWQPAADESSETQTLRAELIRRLAALGHAPTVAEAQRRLTAALAPAAPAGGAALAASVNGVAPSTRAAIINAAARQADAAQFDALLAALRASDSQEERRMLSTALGGGSSITQAQRLLDEALSGRLPPDISARLAWRVAAVPALQAMAYAFVVAHWQALAVLAGDNAFGTRHWLLPAAAQASSNPAAVAVLLADQRRLDGAAGDSTAAQVAAVIEARHRLREREAAPLAAALQGWAPRAAASAR